MDAATSLPVVSPYSQGLDATGHSLEDLFPQVDPEFDPFGHRVVLQLRRVFKATRSGIILTEETKQNEAYNIQVARVVKCGPLAFKKRDSGQPWPEGVWAQPGDFVKILRFGGDQWSVPVEGGEPVIFRLVSDSDLLGKYTGNPLAVKAYIA
jgi:co-chaperonin GroES (HSP10)